MTPKTSPRYRRRLLALFLLVFGLAACFQPSPSPTPSGDPVGAPPDPVPRESSAEVVLRNGIFSTQSVPDAATIGEVLKYRIAQADPFAWQSASLSNSYVDPVVICQPLSFNGGQPATVRLRNVSSESFEFQIDEWDYLDGGHTSEDVSCLVVEAGRHLLGDGTMVEAGTVDTDHTYERVSLTGQYDGTPVVLTQSQTANGPSAITTRQRRVAGGFEVKVQEEEANDGTHALETVGYIAMEVGASRSNGMNYLVGATPAAVTDTRWYDITFNGLSPSGLDLAATCVPNEPLFLAGLQSEFGADPATLRYTDLSLNGVRVFVEEENSIAPSETIHVPEVVGYVAFETGCRALDAPSSAGITVLSRTHISESIELSKISVGQPDTLTTYTLPFVQIYDQPVVFMQPPSFNGSHPLTVRIHEVTSSSVRFQLDEWDYLDGGHTTEEISVLVVDAGVHTLGNAVIEARSFVGNHVFEAVTFQHSFAQTPAVLSQVQSYNGPSAVTTRQRSATTTGVEIALQEEEANDGVHAPETIGHLAMSVRSGSGDGVNYSALNTPNAVTDAWYELSLPSSLFENSPGERPTYLFAGLQTTNGGDPAALRYRNLGPNSAELRVEEEQSFDFEVGHVAETAGVLLFRERSEAAPTNLVINEVMSVQFTNGVSWLELYNPSDAPRQLGDYVLRSTTYDRGSGSRTAASFALPSLTIPAKGYVLVGGRGSDDYQSGPRHVYIRSGDLVPFWAEAGFVELLQNDTTVDFMRFGGDVTAPTTSTWSGSLSTLPRDQGYAFARDLQHTDTDRASDWELIPFITAGGPNDVPANAADTDADGIPDSAEVAGGRFAGLDLYAMGARTDQADIFVEIDYMQSSDEGIVPRIETLDAVVTAFARRGFYVHFDVGPMFSASFDPSRYNLGGGSPVVPYAAGITIGLEPGLANLYEYKAQYMDITRKQVFHYTIFGNSQESDGVNRGIVGLAELLGNDLLVTLGDFGFENASSDPTLTNLLINFQSATLMHELGHNLGLRHGGNDNVNRKPNYFSIMNYLYNIGLGPEQGPGVGDRYYYHWRLNGVTSICQLVNSPCGAPSDVILDFSDGSGSTFNEGDFDERAGIGRGPGDIDYNDDGSIAFSVAFDVNRNGSSNTHRDYDDWGNLVLPFARYFAGNTQEITPQRNPDHLSPLSDDRQPVVGEEPLPAHLLQSIRALGTGN